MLTFNVDAEGKRIETDILVAGYVRDCGKKCELLIPEDINKICFAFWFINITDEWDQKYLADSVEITGQTACTKGYSLVSIYGSLVVDESLHSWRLKLISDRLDEYWIY